MSPALASEFFTRGPLLFLIILLIFFIALCWVFTVAIGLSPVAANGAALGCGTQLPIAVASLVAEHRL